MTRIKRFLSSPAGRVFVALTVLVPAIMLYLHFAGILGPYLSPGPISAVVSKGVALAGFHSHAEFEHDCLFCHQPVHCFSASRCQECHTEVALQRVEGEGLHGVLPGTDKCQTCHPEHRGREANLTEVPVLNIDHSLVSGFSLEHHQVDYDGNPMNCESCHPKEQFAAQDMTCAECHEAYDDVFVQDHGERFGGQCMACHDGVDRMVNFNHDTIYVLDGAHAGAECESCHANHEFAQTASDCAGCHASDQPEGHVAQMGPDCARCHTAVAWTPAELREHVFVIDHGNEGAPDCAACHVDSYVVYTCEGCHAGDEMVDAHLLAKVEMEGDCAECHPTGGPGEGQMARNADSIN